MASRDVHGPNWSDSLPGEPPSCACGFNGTPEECASWRQGAESDATHVEWGLIVLTRDGKTLLPEAEICKTREQAEERARQEGSFGMTVIVASRRVTEWQPVSAPGEERA